MKRRENEGKRAPSLLDSLYYQNALKFNALEAHKLDKATRTIKETKHTVSNQQSREWENMQQWLLDLHKTSGNADLEKYNKLIEAQSDEEEETTPSYYFMYGMRIGERPKLLKNFLGGTTRRKSNKNSKKASKKEIKLRVSEDMKSVTSDETFSSTKLQDEKPNQIMIGDQIVTQVPIGYSSSCVRQNSYFSSCTSEGMKRERHRKPTYYKRKHKYILPPVDMFR